MDGPLVSFVDRVLDQPLASSEQGGQKIGDPRLLDLSHGLPPVTVVPVGKWNVVPERALRFGMWLSLGSPSQ